MISVAVIYPIQEFGFFGGKAVLRKLFGEQIDDERSSRSTQQASGASGWKERKSTCSNPFCRTHGHRHQQQERADRVQSTHTNSGGGRYNSPVTNSYGVTDDLGVEGNEDGIPASPRKSRVPSDDESAAVASSSSVKLKPKRKQSNQIRYTEVGASMNICCD